MSFSSYERREEIVSSLTHGIGVLVSIAGMVVLLLRSFRLKDPWMVSAFGVYGTSLILLYLASTLYHAVPYPKIKTVLRVIDHNSIYILIAGTYTPFTLVSLRGTWGWSLFGAIWGLAFAGIIFNTFSFGRLPKIETVTYVLMGWISAIALHRLLSSIGLTGVILLITGGIVYTLGVIFYNWDDFPYNHAIWHLFVLGGGVSHFLVIYFFVTPQ